MVINRPIWNSKLKNKSKFLAVYGMVDSLLHINMSYKNLDV